jgi:hypothetical protein
LLEGLEQARLVGVGYAAPGIGDAHGQHQTVRGRRGCQRHGHLTAIGELHRIADEVEQDLAQPPGIALDTRLGASRNADAQADALLVELRQPEVARLDCELAQLDRMFGDRELARVDTRQVQQVRQQAFEVLAALRDGLGETLRLARRQLRVEQVGDAHDAGQRRADLVADEGERAGARFGEAGQLALDVVHLALGILLGAGALGVLFGHGLQQHGGRDDAGIGPLLHHDHAFGQRAGRLFGGALGDQRGGCVPCATTGCAPTRWVTERAA